MKVVIFIGAGSAPVLKTTWQHQPRVGDEVRVEGRTLTIRHAVLVESKGEPYYEVRVGLP